MSLKPSESQIAFSSSVDEDEAILSTQKKTYSKKSVMFFTWSQDVFFVNSASEDCERASTRARGLWGNPLLGNRSVHMTCSNCRQAVNTRVHFKPSWKSYVSTVGFSIIGLVCCSCCCIPLRYKLFHQGEHFCPLCQIFMGHAGTEWSWVRLRNVHWSPHSHR